MRRIPVLNNAATGGKNRLVGFTVLLILATLPLFAGGCRLLGVAELTPLNPESASPALTLRIFEGDPGDSWPREGEVLFWLSGSQVPIESLGWPDEGTWWFRLYLYGGDDATCSNAMEGIRVTLWEAGDAGNVPWTVEDASDGRVDINLFGLYPIIPYFATKSYWGLAADLGYYPEPIYCGPANWAS